MAGIEVTKITGIKEAKDAIEKVAESIETSKEIASDLGPDLVKKASAIAPRLSGALASSIGFKYSDNKLQLFAGSGSVPYAGVQEYGWDERNIEAQPYLGTAVFDSMGNIVEKYEDNIKSIIKKYNLD